MSGPLPKLNAERRRTNHDGQNVELPATGAPMPAADPDWHPLTARWYASLGESVQSQLYEASDWQLACEPSCPSRSVGRVGLLAQPRRTQRRPARMARDEPALIARLIALARRFGRYGSRRIMALLRAEGWRVNHKRVERLWRQEGRRVPRKPRRRAERPNPVWSDDCVSERTHDGRPLRLRTIVDEHTRACRSIAVARRRRSDGVLACRTALFVRHGPPSSRRSDHGPAFTATAVRSWLRRLGVTTRCIEPGSPWENGDVESFTGTRRDECRNPEICTTRTEAQVRIERWRHECNQVRTHSALGYRPPAPEALEIGLPHPTPWAVRRVPMLT